MHESDFDGVKYAQRKQADYRQLKYAALCSLIGALLIVLGVTL